MKNSTRYILIVICIIMILLAAGGVVWAFANKFSDKAYADYEDLAGTNTLVNFNQILKISTVSSGVVKVNDYTIKNNSYTSGYFPANVNTINFTSGHIYYLKGSGDYRLYFNGGSTQRFNTIMQPTSDLSTTQIFTNVYTLGTFSFNVIDLTQMFGAGNEPNLEQAQEYFNADYYNYNTGTPIPYSKDYLQGYQDGANDLYDSLTVTYNAYTVGSSSTIYSNSSIEQGELIFDSQYGAYAFTGVLAINLFGNVEKGTNFTVDFELFIPELQGESNIPAQAATYMLYFGYVDENNNLIQITSLTPRYLGSWTNKYTGDFVLPATTSTIYIYNRLIQPGSNDAYSQFITYKSEIVFKSTDIGLLMNNAYQRGASAIQQKYDPNGEEYRAIYGLGYQNGLAAQNATLGTMEYIGAAFTGIGTILQIELLPGVPFSLFILLPLMFGLIAFVVKLTKGGS